MKSKIVFNKKERKNYFSRDEYEDCSELLLILEEFKSEYEGNIILEFDNLKILEIEFDFEFIVEHEDFFSIIEFLDNEKNTVYNIWVCEQGSDYYINHKKDNLNICISFIKGETSSLVLSDFEINIPLDEYKMSWINIFQDLFFLIIKNFPKHRDFLTNYLKRLKSSS